MDRTAGLTSTSRVSRTLTMILISARDPDQFDDMSFEDRRSDGGGWTKFDLLHDGEPDVLVRKALDLDQGVYGAARARDESVVVEASVIFRPEIKSAAELLEPFMADPRALAVTLIEHAESGEDADRVARALFEKLPEPARGPAEEAATWIRQFFAYVPDAKSLGMGIAWELRTEAACTCAKWEGQTLGRYVTFPAAEFDRLEGGGKYFGRMRCVKCSATFGFEISADWAEVKREVTPLPDMGAFAREVAEAVGGEVAFDIERNPTHAIRIGQHCSVLITMYGAYYRVALPFMHPWTVRNREDWTALKPTLQLALAGHRPVLTLADVVAALPREWNVSFDGEPIVESALMFNDRGDVNLQQNPSSVTVRVWQSGDDPTRELTTLESLEGLAAWIAPRGAAQTSHRAAAGAAIHARLAAERAAMRVPELEEVLAALRAGHEIQVGGGRSFRTFAMREGRLIVIHSSDGSTDEQFCGEDTLREAIADAPNVFDATVQQHQGPVN